MDKLAIAKENIELTDKSRELERKVALYGDRMRELEEIVQKQSEEADKNESKLKLLK